MLYVDYDRFMKDIQTELDIVIPEYNRHSGYFDETNFITCNRPGDNLIYTEIAIKHNDDYSKNKVEITIPFEVDNKKISLNYPIRNNQIVCGINKVNDYLPVYHSIEIASKNNMRDLMDIYYTSYLVISAELIIKTDLNYAPEYTLDDLYFDFKIHYRTLTNYNNVSVQAIFSKVDDKLKRVLDDESIDYDNIPMIEKVQLYNIAQKLKA